MDHPTNSAPPECIPPDLLALINDGPDDLAYQLDRLRSLRDFHEMFGKLVRVVEDRVERLTIGPQRRRHGFEVIDGGRPA